MYGQMRPITGKVDKRLLIPAVTIGHFATVVDSSGTAIVLPSIAEEFDLDIAVVAWVTVAALLAVISLLLPMGRLADLVGRKAIYLRGLAVMSSGLVLSAISGNLPLLLIGRVITGAGAAMVMTSAIAIVIAIFPTHERGRALGLVIFAVGLGAVIGPVVSGALVDAFGWRAPFAFTATVTFTGWVRCAQCSRRWPTRPLRAKRSGSDRLARCRRIDDRVGNIDSGVDERRPSRLGIAAGRGRILDLCP